MGGIGGLVSDAKKSPKIAEAAAASDTLLKKRSAEAQARVNGTSSRGMPYAGLTGAGVAATLGQTHGKLDQSTQTAFNTYARRNPLLAQGAAGGNLSSLTGNDPTKIMKGMVYGQIQSHPMMRAIGAGSAIFEDLLKGSEAYTVGGETLQAKANVNESVALAKATATHTENSLKTLRELGATSKKISDFTEKVSGGVTEIKSTFTSWLTGSDSDK